MAHIDLMIRTGVDFFTFRPKVVGFTNAGLAVLNAAGMPLGTLDGVTGADAAPMVARAAGVLADDGDKLPLIPAHRREMRVVAQSLELLRYSLNLHYLATIKVVA